MVMHLSIPIISLTNTEMSLKMQKKKPERSQNDYGQIILAKVQEQK